ncbi:MAG: hypothetical protein QXO67_03505 [Candidatus Bathyarchaeia archaeon]
MSEEEEMRILEFSFRIKGYKVTVDREGVIIDPDPENPGEVATFSWTVWEILKDVVDSLHDYINQKEEAKKILEC